jgi:phospholipid/cholesterol/gamma-HCH transport system permease protein
MSIRNRIENIGGRVIDGAATFAELARVFSQTVAATFRGGRPRGEVANQMYVIGNKSLMFVAVTLGFIGMVMVYQMCLQLNRITGDLTQVGTQIIKLLLQDFAPTITALMLATRVGAGIAAEIGSMKVTEQVDALRMSGVTPINYLIAPRFIACLVMTYVMTVFAVCVAYGAGGLTAYYSYGVNPRVYFDLGGVEWYDFIIGSTKAVCYGMAIPVVSGFCGLRAKGSSEGVGWATTAAVIGSSLAIIVLDFIISLIGLLVRSGGLG